MYYTAIPTVVLNYKVTEEDMARPYGYFSAGMSDDRVMMSSQADSCGSMIPLSVQAESDNVTYGKTVDLHESPHLETTNFWHVLDKPIECPAEFSRESKVKIEDFPRTSFYTRMCKYEDTHFVIICSNHLESKTIDNAGRLLQESLLKMNASLVRIFLTDVIGEILSCMFAHPTPVTEDKKEFTTKGTHAFESRKTKIKHSGKTLYITCDKALGKLSVNNFYGIIRFLLWVDPFITHFQEIKIPPSLDDANYESDSDVSLTSLDGKITKIVEFEKKVVNEERDDHCQTHDGVEEEANNDEENEKHEECKNAIEDQGKDDEGRDKYQLWSCDMASSPQLTKLCICPYYDEVVEDSISIINDEQQRFVVDERWEWFDEVEPRCNIVDGGSVVRAVGKTAKQITGLDGEDPRFYYVCHEPDGSTSFNRIEGTQQRNRAFVQSRGMGRPSSVLALSLALLNFVREGNEKIMDYICPKQAVQGKMMKQMKVRNVVGKIIATWLVVAVIMGGVSCAALALSEQRKSSDMIKKEKFLKAMFDNVKMCNTLGTPLDENGKLTKSFLLGMENTVSSKKMKIWKKNRFCMAKSGKDFLQDVLNVPDFIKLPPQIIQIYPIFEQKGFNDEMRRLASFSQSPETESNPAVLLAENGFYYDPRSSVICNFCKIKHHKWQNDWNPKEKHNADCPLIAGLPCGNVPMKPSEDNGKYQLAVSTFFNELKLQELDENVQALHRDSMRSLDTFKNPQLPEHQMETLSITTVKRREPSDDAAVFDQPIPSSSSSSAPPQPQPEKAGTLRYFVHTYDDRGRPISTAQKIEVGKKEQKTNSPMKSESERLKSFEKVWKKSNIITPAELAKAGFYYAGAGDRVRCVFCNGVLRNWAVGDHAASEHRRHYPTCPFVLNLDVGNVPIVEDMSGLRTPTQSTRQEPARPMETANPPQPAQASTSFSSVASSVIPGTILIPKHVNFSTVQTRLLTYDAWPASNKKTPDELATAGFFYTGSGDNVRCFHCDGGLRNWLSSDVPWVEHAKWFPRCGYLQREKGPAFVLQEMRNNNAQNPAGGMAQSQGSSGQGGSPSGNDPRREGIVERPIPANMRRIEAREVRARFDTEPAKMLISMGYKEAVVKYVILERLRNYADDFPSTQHLFEAVLAEEPRLEEKGIEFYENILKQEFDRPLPIVHPNVGVVGGGQAKPASSAAATPLVQATAASLEIPDDEKSLLEQNRQLKEQTTCKICMDNEVSMVFVPCGHLVACSDCAPSLRQCPICRRPITGTIRTFLS